MSVFEISLNEGIIEEGTIDIQASTVEELEKVTDILKSIVGQKNVVSFPECAYPYARVKVNKQTMAEVKFMLGLGDPEEVYFY